MTPTVGPTIPTTHPVVRAMAEELARDFFATLEPVVVGDATLDAPAPAEWFIAAHVHFLTDMRRPATRDIWIRWGRKFALDAVMSGDPVRIVRDGPSVARWGEQVRDNPEALTAAVCAALETM